MQYSKLKCKFPAVPVAVTYNELKHTCKKVKFSLTYC